MKGFQPIMPTFQGLVSEEQVNALVAYIKSISPAKPADGAKTNASLVPSRDEAVNRHERERMEVRCNEYG